MEALATASKDSQGRSAELNRAVELYGAVKEGVHVAGYTLERAWGHLEWLLDEDHWREVGEFADVNAFLDSIPLDSFRIVAEQRRRIAKRIKELQPEASTRAVGKLLGAHHSTVAKDVVVGNSTVPRQKTQDGQRASVGNPTTAITGADAAKIVGRAEAKADSADRAAARREALRNAEPLADGMELRIGDCREVLKDVAGNSVALVLTDPPYQAEAEPLYVWLAEFAARVLIPGGSLICYTGHWSINRDVAIFDKHLRYWWLLCMLHNESRRLPGKFIIANHKPVLWYVKGHRRGNSLVPDVLRPPQREKEQHAWGQGEGGVTDLITHLTEPAELIVDPFAGTSTWGRIAARMGRRWLGADIIEGGAATIKADPIEGEAEEVAPPDEAGKTSAPAPHALDSHPPAAGDDGLDIPHYLRRAPPGARP